MTDRDYQVVEFISKCPCYSNTIQKIFYPSKVVSNRRLRKLTDYGHLKRYREHSYEYYFYYTKNKPKQMIHLDYIARAYKYIQDLGYTILFFDTQRKINNIIPDMHCVIKKDNKIGKLAVEVDLSNSSLENKLKKYNDSVFSKILLFSKRTIEIELKKELIQVDISLLK